ncbi:MAG: tRNA (N(6)-L-threonylcarbamoyladenosine(37)-C(2))-methylthiotransferase MtaB [Candidatus Acidiferrales bacterium]
MATFSIENFGCRATDADAAALRRDMLEHGLALVDEHASADVVVLNTCTVTAAADSQAREAVRKIHRANPGARIVVTGCYAQRAPEELAAIDGVDFVIGNSHQTDIAGLIRATLDSQVSAEWVTRPEGAAAGFLPLARIDRDAMSLARGPAKILTGDIFAQTAVQISSASLAEGGRTRPILKIQDGCNNRCSYCVIPFVRGRSRSLPPDVVIAEVRKLVDAGAKEVVLSGINLGSYGRDLTPRTELLETARRILSETRLEQLRFSSIEPQDVTGEFIGLVASSDRIAAHFHVPLQSGSDRILRAMHRWYRAEHYAERVRLIRRHSPDAAIGADVITGFPSETDDEFQATFEFIERLPLTYLHVFSFSARPGTEAAKLTAECRQIAPGVIRERARHLRALGRRKSDAFRSTQAGRTLRALTLARTGDNWTEALTGNYLKVRIAGHMPPNQWCEALIAPGASAAIFEDHFGQREVAAVRDRE